MDTDPLTPEPVIPAYARTGEPIHGHLPWDDDEIDLSHHRQERGTCRHPDCDLPISDPRVTTCLQHRGWWIAIRKKTRRQVRRLCELARERKAAP